MKYCRKCGTALDDNAVYCTTCGNNQNNIVTVPVKEDKGGFLWGLLGFFVPVAGLVLYLVWKYDKPKTARAAGIGAIISVAFGVLCVLIVWFILLFAMFLAVGLQ